MTPAEFFAQVRPYAVVAGKVLDLWPSVIMAQWADEVEFGNAYAEPNNVGNVGVFGGGPNPSFATLGEGVNAYVQFMEGSNYAPVRATYPQGPFSQALALGRSPYASGHYTAPGGVPGSSLVSLITQYGLTAYDGPLPAPPPAPPPKPPAPLPEEEQMQIFTVVNGTGYVIAADLSTKRGIPDPTDAAALISSGCYVILDGQDGRKGPLTAQLVNAIPNG